MKRIRFLVMVSALFLCSAQPKGGLIKGTVTSASSGERIAHALIALDNTSCKTFSDTNGVFRLWDIPDGIYNLTISAPGYSRMKIMQIIVPIFTPLEIPVQLRDFLGDSTVISTTQFLPPGGGRILTIDRMKFYQPDSTIDYKILIAGPQQKPPRGRFAVPDSILRRR